MPRQKINFFPEVKPDRALIIRKNLRQIFVVPVCLIFGSFALLIFTFIILIENFEGSVHSSEVISQARVAFGTVNETQKSLKNYKVSKNPSNLQEYQKNLLEIEPANQKLLSMVRDNPEQTMRVEELIRMNKDIASYLGQQLALGDRLNNPVEDLLEWDAMMDTLLAQYRSFINQEEILQKSRYENVYHLRTLTIYLGLGIALGLALTFTILIYRKIRLLTQDYESILLSLEEKKEAVKQAEVELQQQHDWFRGTLTSIGDAVLATDLSGHVTFINQEALKLTGWSEVDAVGQLVSELVQVRHEETRENLPNLVDEVLALRKSASIVQDAVLVGRNIEEIPIQASASPIFDQKNAMLGVVLVFHDASIMREVQKNLLNYSKELEGEVSKRTVNLKNALMEMEAFSYTVSHDLRSPLRAMQGYAEALLEDQGDRLNEEGRNYLNRIKAAAERLDRLIQDLLSYSRVIRETVPMEIVDTHKLVQDLITQYPNLQAPAADVAIRGHLPQVRGGEALLTQIFSNLLGNAVKFVAPGVKPVVQVYAEKKEQRVRFFVEDNGIGISPDNHERIFRIFEQLNEPKLYTGTGVGLALVMKAVEKLGGTIGIDSNIGQGTRFWFELDEYQEPTS